MPPIPRQAPKKPKRKPDDIPSGVRGSTSSIPSQDSFSTKTSPSRTGKAASLETKVSIFYKMCGTFLSPVGRWYPAAGILGANLTKYSDEAAEAWMELADENTEVKKMLEALTSASAWGNVIGVHFAIVVDKQQNGGIDMNDPNSVMQAMMNNLSPEDVDRAMKLAGMDKGGPGDTIQSDRPPEEAIPEPIVTAPPVNTQSKGMPTPEQLGVTDKGQAQSHVHDSAFPTNSGPVQGIKGNMIP